MPALALSPLPVDRPWGGHRIARRFGWDDSRPRGEWWLASCRDDARTPLRLRAGGAPADLAAWLAGPGRGLGLPAPADFPLLVKFLDSEQLLSLQVHPDDAVAARQGLPRGKTEAWVVLEAEPGAGVYLGTAEGVAAATLLDRVAAGAGDDEVRSLLRRIEVGPGDVLLVRAGTVHAIGPGLAIFEVQQNSDTTWRIHDWGRGRPVHLAQARQAARDLAPPVVLRAAARGAAAAGAGAGAWQSLLATDAFTLRAARVSGRQALGVPRRYALLTVLEGHGRLSQVGRPEGRLELAPGDTVFVHEPAVLEGEALSVLVVDPP